MNKLSFIPAALLATGVALAANSMPADAFSLSFTNVSNNGSTNVAPNFNVDVTDAGNGKVQFTFSNTGSAGVATMNQVYFGTQNTFPQYLSTSNVSVVNGPGVQFSSGATPNNPGGGIAWDAAYAADPDSPGGFGKNAVDVGESVSFVFNLANGAQYNQLEGLFNSGTLAVALHAQSIGGSGGYSDWFASNSSITSKDIPEPITILGTGAAIGFGGLFRREQSKRQSKAKIKA